MPTLAESALCTDGCVGPVGSLCIPDPALEYTAPMDKKLALVVVNNVMEGLHCVFYINWPACPSLLQPAISCGLGGVWYINFACELWETNSGLGKVRMPNGHG